MLDVCSSEIHCEYVCKDNWTLKTILNLEDYLERVCSDVISLLTRTRGVSIRTYESEHLLGLDQG